MSSRRSKRARRAKARRRRRREKRERTLPEELFGDVWARRLRYGIPGLAGAVFLSGCFVFVMWSQTIGRLVMAPSVFVGGLWLMFRHGIEDDFLARWRRKRWWFLGLGLVFVVGGWVAFLTVDGDLGLLGVLIGAIAILMAALDVRQDHAGGPTDGPWYGETNG